MTREEFENLSAGDRIWVEFANAHMTVGYEKPRFLQEHQGFSGLWDDGSRAWILPRYCAEYRKVSPL